MRDSRESRLLLVLLVAIAFALITVDLRGGEQSPLDGARGAAASALGPVEKGVASAVDPVGNAIGAVRDSGARHDRISRLEQENAALRQKLGSDDRNRSRARELDRLLKTAGAGSYGVKGAQVIAIGPAQGFSWTVTIDAGSKDGLAKDMTVLNGDGLVGRITTVGSSTSTVLLANDPDFTVGTRMEKSSELGFATGGGDRALSVQLLNGKAKVKKGDRLVTFGSNADKPFVPGVPVGEVTKVDRHRGDLTRAVSVRPYVGFSKLDIVGVVVKPPRSDPRDAVLEAKKPEKPTPTVTVTATPGAPEEGEEDAGEAPESGSPPGDAAPPAEEPGTTPPPEGQ
ncbi:rod shape-determining protein MreC [Streptomyces xiaopingdaonensis]|uniref:rod shape-determining protein MreC n=1 Tax=Streptomyces xiaopingdaonensis TaxID=1565415 RepID=UPI00030DB23D|nr:rod shape-determining protein MreC [Streptomyces xiaopingdaonensis]